MIIKTAGEGIRLYENTIKSVADNIFLGDFVHRNGSTLSNATTSNVSTEILPLAIYYRREKDAKS